MKATRIISLALVLLAAAAGCTKEGHFQRKVVVEGWIDDGGYPVVILSKNVDISGGQYSLTDSTSLMALWAKVSIVRDKVDTTILAGMVDRRYMPPYIYTTWKFKGEVGRTYELIVEYDHIIEKAVTTIPQPVKLDTIYAEKLESNDTLYTIKADFRNEGDGHYYKFFTRVKDEENRYYPSYLGDIDGHSYGEQLSYNVYRGDYDIRYRVKDENGKIIHRFSPYYRKSDEVDIKFSTMTEYGFRFWQSFENDFLVSTLLYPPHGGIESNITVVQDEYGPQNYMGNGTWIGYGSTYYSVRIADYVE